MTVKELKDILEALPEDDLPIKIILLTYEGSECSSKKVSVHQHPPYDCVEIIGE